MRRRPAIVLVALCLLAIAAPASADSADGAQVHDLAVRALSGDGTALDELRAVDHLDGVEVDLSGLLADPATRQVRLQAIAALTGTGDAAPLDRAEIDSAVTDILSQPGYPDMRPSLLQRLLGPVYDWMQRVIVWVIDHFVRLLSWLLSLMGEGLFRILGPVVLTMAVVVGTVLLGRRRAREIERRSAIERILELGRDPEELERLAVEAAAGGDHALAIRLRFVAGLLRLDGLGLIEFYPGLASATISEQLSDPGFDRLSEQFDQVVYGKRPASAADLDAAVDGWRRVLGVRT